MLGEFLITSEHEQKIGLMSDSGNEYWEKESSLFGRIWYKLSTNLSLAFVCWSSASVARLSSAAVQHFADNDR